MRQIVWRTAVVLVADRSFALRLQDSSTQADNFIDRWLLGVQAMPAPDGRLALGWSLQR